MKNRWGFLGCFYSRRSTWKRTWRSFARAASANDLYWIIDFPFPSRRNALPFACSLAIDPAIYNGYFSFFFFFATYCISLATATLAVIRSIPICGPFFFVLIYGCYFFFPLVRNLSVCRRAWNKKKQKSIRQGGAVLVPPGAALCNIRDKDHYYTFREMFPGNFLIEKMSLQSP